jgi:hypothetical protein
MARTCTARVKRTQTANALVMDCKACEGKGMLGDGDCLASVLEHYMSEFSIDSIVLSGYVERQYEGSAIRLLEKLRSLAETLEQLSARNPVREYFMENGEGDQKDGKEKGASAKEEKQKGEDPGCGSCAVNSQVIFAEMHEQLMGDISEFYKGFVHHAQQVEKGKGPRCSQCLFHTGNDLIFLHNQMDDLRRYVAHEGFGIVLE